MPVALHIVVPTREEPTVLVKINLNMTAKQIIHELTPPLVWRGMRGLLGMSAPTSGTEIMFRGNYPSWHAARNDSTGYDASVILERTRAATMEVKQGRVAFERDSVVFREPDWSWPLIASLLRVAVENDGRLCVLDFGGALGSTYLSCRPFFSVVPRLRWCVVEQPAYIDYGLKEFADDRLAFYADIDECCHKEMPDVLLCSSVLQYLESPWDFIAKICRKPFPFVLVDRTTVFRDNSPDRLTVQTVPEWIYPASYPCWMLNYDRLKRCFSESYEVLAQFPAHSGVLIPFEETHAEYAGLLLRRNS